MGATRQRSAFEPLESRTLFSSVPAGFSISTFASGLVNPTAMAFAPDGRLFVSQQGGQLRVIDHGVLQPTPFVSLNVDSAGERGLLGIAFDPHFSQNHFVYVYHTVPGTPAHNQVTRFTANGDVAVPGSAVNIFDLSALSDRTNHNGGALHFGADGKLYISAGENANPSNAQSLSNTLGKILRINPDGSIPTDNPFYTQTTGNNRAIWAYGLRNPFTFNVDPRNGRLFIDDVGFNTWEEIDQGKAGANYGWPVTEGPFNASQYSQYTEPLYAYQHGPNDVDGEAITGGTFYDPAGTTTFPSAYIGKYFFSDLGVGFVKMLDPATGAASNFATGFSNPVDLEVGGDGALYVLSRGAGAVQRIQYTATTPQVQRLTPTDDAFVRDGAAANSNFGQNPHLFSLVGPTSQNRVSYLSFDISHLGSIGEVVLRLDGFLSYANALQTVGVYGVSDTSWSERSIHWNTRPKFTAPPIATARMSGTAYQFVQWDVTSYVLHQKQLGHTRVSFALSNPTAGGPLAVFNSKESINGPELDVTPLTIITTSSARA